MLGTQYEASRCAVHEGMAPKQHLPWTLGSRWRSGRAPEPLVLEMDLMNKASGGPGRRGKALLVLGQEEMNWQQKAAHRTQMSRTVQGAWVPVPEIT